MNKLNIYHYFIKKLGNVNTITRLFVTLLVSILITCISGLIIHKIILVRAEKQFINDSEQMKIVLNTSLGKYSDLLMSLHSFIVSNNNITEKQFTKYTQSLSLSNQFPAIHMLDFITNVDANNTEDFYKKLDKEYQQSNTLLFPEINNAISYNKGGIRDTNGTHYIIKYANPIEKAYPYIGLDVTSTSAIHQLYFDFINKNISSSGKIFISKKNSEYPFVVIRIPIFKPSTYQSHQPSSFNGAVGASIRFDRTFFGQINKNVTYIEFQIFSPEEEGKALVYDSRFHRKSMEIPWPKYLFNDDKEKFISTTTFKIGKRDFFIKTFTSALPPNITDPLLITLMLVFIFFTTSSLLYFIVIKRIETKNFSDKVEQHVSHLEIQLHTDELTQLPNRRAFFFELEQKILSHQQDKKQLFLFFIDLDGFKRVNDTMGHSAGDIVLQDYAVRLKQFSLSNPCHYYRVGGDEFTILLEPCKDKILSLQDVEAFAKKLLTLTDALFFVKGEQFTLTQSIGIAEDTSDGITSEDLFKNSDVAMYEAKRQGKNCYLFFAKRFSEAIEHRNSIINHLITAVEKNEFYLEFQPKMKLINNQYKMQGIETLLRWNNSKIGLISPHIFIPLAEEAGLMPKIGIWVINELGKTLHRWRNTPLSNIKVAINISAKQFLDDNLPDYYANVLSQFNIDPHNIIIEVTESAMMKEPQKTKIILNRFREFGFGVSVDDFGTGHSSLSYLRQFPVTEIKIDKSFTDDILIDEHDLIIVEGIISMSQKLKLDVVVEGVESLAQVKWLEKQSFMGESVSIQGYYFSKPLKEDKLFEFFKQY